MKLNAAEGRRAWFSSARPTRSSPGRRKYEDEVSASGQLGRPADGFEFLPHEILNAIFEHLAPGGSLPLPVCLAEGGRDGSEVSSHSKWSRNLVTLCSACLTSRRLGAVARRLLYRKIEVADGTTLVLVFRALSENPGLASHIRTLACNAHPHDTGFVWYANRPFTGRRFGQRSKFHGQLPNKSGDLGALCEIHARRPDDVPQNMLFAILRFTTSLDGLRVAIPTDPACRNLLASAASGGFLPALKTLQLLPLPVVEFESYSWGGSSVKITPAPPLLVFERLAYSEGEAPGPTPRAMLAPPIRPMVYHLVESSKDGAAAPLEVGGSPPGNNPSPPRPHYVHSGPAPSASALQSPENPWLRYGWPRRGVDGEPRSRTWWS